VEIKTGLPSRFARDEWPSTLVWGLIAIMGSPLLAQDQPEDASRDLLNELKSYRHKILHESFRDGNWDIYLMNADGSNPVNLTNTPDIDELYPKASPDGQKICFQADEGKEETKVRRLYLMDIDGTHRIKIADHAREPCWSADGKKIAYLPDELENFTYADGATKGIRIYDLATKETHEHPNPEILHLYTLNWSPDGRWFVATVHGGMGYKHGILALEADGNAVFDLGLIGCRPDLSADGKKIAWGHGDFAMGSADLDLSGPAPKVSGLHNIVLSKEFETYHVDWSPDGKYIAYSYGPRYKGKSIKGLLPEFPGVQAPGWNTCIADASKKNCWVQITFDGKSNKEPDWVYVKETAGK
jgi:TolB protein